MAKNVTLCVRLEEEAAQNLERIIEETGLNKSIIINQMLMQGDKVCVVDGRQLASELQRIRMHIDKPWLKETDSCKLATLCNTVTDYFYKMVCQTEEKYGDIKSN